METVAEDGMLLNHFCAVVRDTEGSKKMMIPFCVGGGESTLGSVLSQIARVGMAWCLKMRLTMPELRDRDLSHPCPSPRNVVLKVVRWMGVDLGCRGGGEMQN